ncbi:MULTISPECIES: SDR family NAD(P)-dependent oxidoreductase [unclassified Variovorax]|uniref:SDR family NAD(P)-dependent oxidoreductase n=1 Tax=unclassified Variovorax TaxID=663243 RepID=UPI00076CDE98|nr:MULTISPECIES: SDR family NAD(P)-dependent oxidoreductase [unclassified Variovorax]KWT72578.1 short-chain dehydrogenase/reductase SDR [Variovorax sp. WDL1]PNG58436.1 putative oxidoreductase [Variovorax sp. B4]PNG61774.1 putative oxidoreductase [Variovorax sp. B2]VTV12168.1 putative oxidoreductase [Variovorax sp. WDL1]
MEASDLRPLAIVTGASSGIGLELAKLAARNGHDLVIGADEPMVQAEAALQALGADVTPVQADLATRQGVDDLLAAAGGRPIEALFANAGHGLGGAFLEQDFDAVQHVIHTNITGTIYLLQQAARAMVQTGRGRILVTGSIAGFQPGSFQAVYNGTKAFIDSFSLALRNELKDTGVTVSCLMPGVTDTHFFARANMLDTKVGQQDDKADPAEVAEIGYEAMMKGEADVIAGWKNKFQVALSRITPSERVAEQHRKLAEPGTAKQS